MSLMLKGIDLPAKKNEPLKLEIYSDGGVCVDTGSDFECRDNVAVQLKRPHGRLKDFDGDGVHPIIVDGEYMVKVDDLGEMPTIFEAEE